MRSADLPYDGLSSINSPAYCLRRGNGHRFFARWADMDINLNAERRHMVLNEMTATVARVFGLSIGCANATTTR